METNAIEQWIKDANGSDWRHVYKIDFEKNLIVLMNMSTGGYGKEISIYKALLDPKAWQAVGKTRVNLWGSGIGTADIPQSHLTPMWKIKWHKFYDHLADGHDINSSLNEIE